MQSPPLPVLLRTALAGETPRASPALLRALEGPVDVHALAQLALEHRVAPWFAALVANEPALASDARFELLTHAAAGQTLRSLRQFAELRRLLRALNERQVPAVVLKGPVLAQELYPDPALRPYGDVDILIHEADLDTVSALLRERGYADKNEHDHSERLHHCHGLFQRIMIHHELGSVVEIHCDHLQIGLEPVSMDEIWARSQPVSFGSETAHALANDDLFVQLCVHLHRHGFERLIWFKDLDLLIRSGLLDYEQVRVRAEQQDCLDSVAYTLWLLARMLRTPLPPPLRELTREQGRWSRLVYRAFWPPQNVLGLVPQRQWRFRRIVQFAPETGLLRGGLPGLLLPGRRRDKLSILFHASTRALRSG